MRTLLHSEVPITAADGKFQSATPEISPLTQSENNRFSLDKLSNVVVTHSAQTGSLPPRDQTLKIIQGFLNHNNLFAVSSGSSLSKTIKRGVLLKSRRRAQSETV